MPPTLLMRARQLASGDGYAMRSRSMIYAQRARSSMASRCRCDARSSGVRSAKARRRRRVSDDARHASKRRCSIAQRIAARRRNAVRAMLIDHFDDFMISCFIIPLSSFCLHFAAAHAAAIIFISIPFHFRCFHTPLFRCRHTLFAATLSSMPFRAFAMLPPLRLSSFSPLPAYTPPISCELSLPSFHFADDSFIFFLSYVFLFFERLAAR